LSFSDTYFSILVAALVGNSVSGGSFALIVANDVLVLIISFLIKAFLDRGMGAFWVTLHVLSWGAVASILYIGYNLRCLRQSGGQVVLFINQSDGT
jgi:hypothetical protein